MGCNCKKSVELEKKYGVNEEENLITKITRWLFKMVVFIIAMFLAVLVTPIMILVVLYKMFFAKHREIILPKSLRKFIDDK